MKTLCVFKQNLYHREIYFRCGTRRQPSDLCLTVRHDFSWGIRGGKPLTRVVCLTNDILAKTAPQAALAGASYRDGGFRGRRLRFLAAESSRSAWRTLDSSVSLSGL